MACKRRGTTAAGGWVPSVHSACGCARAAGGRLYREALELTPGCLTQARDPMPSHAILSNRAVPQRGAPVRLPAPRRAGRAAGRGRRAAADAAGRPCGAHPALAQARLGRGRGAGPGRSPARLPHSARAHAASAGAWPAAAGGWERSDPHRGEGAFWRGAQHQRRPCGRGEGAPGSDMCLWQLADGPTSPNGPHAPLPLPSGAHHLHHMRTRHQPHA